MTPPKTAADPVSWSGIPADKPKSPTLLLMIPVMDPVILRFSPVSVSRFMAPPDTLEWSVFQNSKRARCSVRLPRAPAARPHLDRRNLPVGVLARLRPAHTGHRSPGHRERMVPDRRVAEVRLGILAETQLEGERVLPIIRRRRVAGAGRQWVRQWVRSGVIKGGSRFVRDPPKVALQPQMSRMKFRPSRGLQSTFTVSPASTNDDKSNRTLD